MKILLVSATFSEIEPLVDRLDLIEKSDDFFLSHKLENKEINLLVTGVGIASTAYKLGKLFANYKYDFAFNLGIAGAFKKYFHLGDVVNVEFDIISELGAENGLSFLKFDELNIGQSSIKKTIWKIINKQIINNPEIQKLPRVKGITVNTVHSDSYSINKVINLFHPDVETMEGAAFLHICNEEIIQCAQLRSISNYVEERNTANWNISKAIENLNETAIRILKTL